MIRVPARQHYTAEEMSALLSHFPAVQV
jgi:hypothetical protein